MIIFQYKEPDSAPATPVDTAFSTTDISSGYASSTTSISSMASLTGNTADSGLGEKAGEKKDKPAKGGKKERLPRVQLRKIEKKTEGLVVECTFDTYKSNRITFRFDVKIDDPEDIADSMVRVFQCRNLLADESATIK